MPKLLSDDDQLQLIDTLADGAWHSGAALAARYGISRAALAKRIDRLDDWGLSIETRSGLGYRLAAPLQRLDAARIRAALQPATQQCLRRVQALPRTDSTNQRLLDSDAGDDPQAVFADLQTAGRGRRGRVWRSPFAANIYGSLAWTFPAWPPQLGTVSLLVGIACAQALQAQGLGAVRLKWPNDLRVGSAKLGGILIEQRGEAGGACRLVIGIGINVAMTAVQAAAIDQAWTTVDAQRAAAGLAPVSREALIAAVLDRLVAALQRFAEEGFAPFLADWQALDLTAGQPVLVLEGEQGFEAIARGINGDGALLVEDAQGGLRALHAGEVSLRLGAS